MGQKVNPNGLRIGINKEWEAQWFAGKKDFGAYILEDNQIRHFIKDVYKPELKATSEEPAVQEGEKFPKKLDDRPRISRVDIERCDKYLKVKVHTARPGLLIGQKGSGTEKIRTEVVKITKKNGHNYPAVIIEFIPVKVADAEAQLVAEEIANQLVKSIADKVDIDFLSTLSGIAAGMTASASAVIDLSNALEKFGEDIDGQKALVVPPAMYTKIRNTKDWAPASEFAAGALVRGDRKSVV